MTGQVFDRIFWTLAIVWVIEVAILLIGHYRFGLFP